MQLAADANMQIVQPTTASQIFHVLRRQMVRNLRKPLVIFTPKSLLRNKDATSPVSEFTKGSFQTVIPDAGSLKADKVKRLVVCSGKVYYDLVKKREERGQDDVAIIRVEQLYPFPHKASLPLRSRSTPMLPKWCGARTNPRTRAPGSSSNTRSTKTCSTVNVWVIQGGPPRLRLLWATPTCIRTSKKRLLMALSASSRASS